MEREEFKNYLKLCGLNKKELAEKLNLPYGTVNNWGTSNPYPEWLKSWLENYLQLVAKLNDDGIIAKAKKYDELMQFIKEQNKEL